MSAMTKCKTKFRPVRALHATQVLETMLVLSVVVGCALLHLYLRFSMVECRRELTQLQALDGTLRSEINNSRAQLEALKRPEQLYENARTNLGLSPMGEGDSEVLMVSADVKERYAALPREIDRQLAAAEKGSAMWDRLAEPRWGLVGEAAADER